MSVSHTVIQNHKPNKYSGYVMIRMTELGQTGSATQILVSMTIVFSMRSFTQDWMLVISWMSAYTIWDLIGRLLILLLTVQLSRKGRVFFLQHLTWLQDKTSARHVKTVVAANSPAIITRYNRGMNGSSCPEGKCSHFLPSHSCTQRLALHLNEHAPDKHCWLQYSTSLVHSIWQLWHCWKQVPAEHLIVLHPAPPQTWLHSVNAYLPSLWPHLHDVVLHFWRHVFDSTELHLSVVKVSALAARRHRRANAVKMVNILVISATATER